MAPFGGNDWLAFTLKPALEPELPIIDAHHHFWDLRPERVPYQRFATRTGRGYPQRAQRASHGVYQQFPEGDKTQ